MLEETEIEPHYQEILDRIKTVLLVSKKIDRIFFESNENFSEFDEERDKIQTACQEVIEKLAGKFMVNAKG